MSRQYQDQQRQLEQRLVEEWHRINAINHVIIERAVRRCSFRLCACVRENGGHFEHWKLQLYGTNISEIMQRGLLEICIIHINYIVVAAMTRDIYNYVTLCLSHTLLYFCVTSLRHVKTRQNQITSVKILYVYTSYSCQQ